MTKKKRARKIKKEERNKTVMKQGEGIKQEQKKEEEEKNERRCNMRQTSRRKQRKKRRIRCGFMSIISFIPNWISLRSHLSSDFKGLNFFLHDI